MILAQERLLAGPQNRRGARPSSYVTEIQTFVAPVRSRLYRRSAIWLAIFLAASALAGREAMFTITSPLRIINSPPGP